VTNQLNSSELLRRVKGLKVRDLRAILRQSILALRMGDIEPERFSRSVALWVFIGLLPIHGMQTLLWLVLIVVIPVEPVLTWLCSWVGNAATAIPLTWLELQIGSYLCRGHFVDPSPSHMVSPERLAQLGGTLLIGALVFAVPCAALVYAATGHWIRSFGVRNRASSPSTFAR
jgi:uncharacterized protein (DUF2062 family)